MIVSVPTSASVASSPATSIRAMTSPMVGIAFSTFSRANTPRTVRAIDLQKPLAAGLKRTLGMTLASWRRMLQMLVVLPWLALMSS